MEDLIELVAASFVRHGIECPAADTELARSVQPKPAREVSSAEPALATPLPEHNYRKGFQGDPAP